MRAVVLREFGPPRNLAVEDLPDPVAGPGQALITVAAAGIPFIETQVRANGGPSPAHRPTLPMIPGNGVGGVVTAVGDGVDPALVGTRVISTTGGSGGYAELVAVDAAEPIPVPDGLELRDAVALLADGRTAVALARAAGPAAGEWVLVEAAGGGLGSLLVQLARDAGARVIGAASGPAKRALAEQVGAEVTVDYTVADWTEQVLAATGGAGVDLAFDGVGGTIGAAAVGLVRDGGRFVIHGMASGSATVVPDGDAERIRVTGLGSIQGSAEDIRGWARAALELAAAGRLRPAIGQTFPLERAADAHAAMEARTALGKTLLVP